MTATPSLRVFVAMRIGNGLTDRLYNKSIRPAVRECGFTAARIDKIEYKEDVDDRILDEIEHADIVIADLTFARPSVYFEGGYAAGLGKPVIYTARRDHFRDKDDDPLGNLRVHFDLMMKNIIDWSEPDSATFRKRLAARVRHVARPIVRARQADKAAADARLNFSRLPLSKRLEAVTDAVAGFLEDREYTVSRLGTKAGRPYALATLLIADRLPDDLLRTGLVGTAKTPGAIDGVWVRIDEAPTLPTLRSVNTLLAMAPPHDMNPPAGVRPTRVVEHVFLCSLRSVPTSRIQTAFKDYEQVANGEFASLMRQIVPTSRTREEILLIGRGHPLSPLWEAMAFDTTGTEYGRAEDYDVQGDYLVKRPSYQGFTIFSLTKKTDRPTPKPEKRGKVREVPRRVSIHVIDGISSVLDLEARLQEVDTRMA